METFFLIKLAYSFFTLFLELFKTMPSEKTNIIFIYHLTKSCSVCICQHQGALHCDLSSLRCSLSQPQWKCCKQSACMQALGVMMRHILLAQCHLLSHMEWHFLHIHVSKKANCDTKIQYICRGNHQSLVTPVCIWLSRFAVALHIEQTMGHLLEYLLCTNTTTQRGMQCFVGWLPSPTKFQMLHMWEIKVTCELISCFVYSSSWNEAQYWPGKWFNRHFRI